MEQATNWKQKEASVYFSSRELAELEHIIEYSEETSYGSYLRTAKFDDGYKIKVAPCSRGDYEDDRGYYTEVRLELDLYDSQTDANYVAGDSILLLDAEDIVGDWTLHHYKNRTQYTLHVRTKENEIIEVQ